MPLRKGGARLPCLRVGQVRDPTARRTAPVRLAAPHHGSRDQHPAASSSHTVVGAKAASASHKVLLLMKSLALESESLQETLRRTVTLLFDYGAESGIWKLCAFSLSFRRGASSGPSWVAGRRTLPLVSTSTSSCGWRSCPPPRGCPCKNG